MTISERIFELIKKRGMTQAEFSKRVGIPASTISDWKSKKSNPSSDKILVICEVLEVTSEQLLSGKGIDDGKEIEFELTSMDKKIIDTYHNMKGPQKKRLLAYMEALKKVEELEEM